MLKAQKRHQAPCTRPEWDQRSCAGANCPVLIIGTLKGERVRLSTGSRSCHGSDDRKVRGRW
jgi:hypothetical protein